MKQYIKLFPMLALTAAVAGSCVDDEVLPFDVAKPESIAQYEYLNNYDVLKSYVDRTAHPGFHLGGAIAATDFNTKGVIYELIRTNFDEMTAGNEMKYASCVSDDGSMNFSTVTSFVETAKEAGVTIYGHTLAWHSQQNLNYLNGLIADQVIEGEPADPIEVEDAMFDYSTFTGYNYWAQKPAGADVSINDDGYLYIYNPEVTTNFYDFQYHVADAIPWKSGIDYNITMMARASEETSITVAAGSWSSNPNTSVVISPEWKEITVTLSPNIDENGFIMFQSGNFAGTIEVQWIKVSHMEIPSGGGDGGYCLTLTNTTQQSANYGAQAWYQFSTPLKSGVSYTFTCMVKATGDYANLAPFLQSSTTSDQAYPAGFSVGTTWAEASISFTPDKDVYDKFTFNFGDFVGTIYIDDVKIVEAGSSVNLVSNGDFEAANIDGWSSWSGYQALSANGEGYSSGSTVIEMTPEEKKDTLTWAMDNWINGMMEACGGYVVAWDAVNEAISGVDADGDGYYDLQSATNGDPSTNFYWQDYLGNEDYVPIVTQAAVKHFAEHGGNAADLKLFINDYNLESWWDGNQKLKSLIHWIEVWEENGAKIDGIGTQMHVSYILNEADQKAQEDAIVNMFQLMAATGKLIKISELDMGIVENAFGTGIKTENVTYEQQLKMAEFYQFIIQKYFEIIPAAQQYGITQWCMTDSPADSGWRGGEPIGLWNLNYSRKPTYGGFANGLAGKVVVEPSATPAE